MNKAQYIQKRRGKYLAQVMAELEEKILPRLPDTVSQEVIDDFKGLLRRKFNALAEDASDVLSLDGAINGYAVETRDRLYPDGRRPSSGVRS